MNQSIEDVLITAIEGLCFYADPDTYFAMSFLADRPCGEFADDFTAIQDVNEAGEVVFERLQPGKYAREILVQLMNSPEVVDLVNRHSLDLVVELSQDRSLAKCYDNSHWTID